MSGRGDQFELRILSGLHQGARVSVHDSLSVGHSTEDDVVLRDEGMAGRTGVVRLADQAWNFSADGEESAQRHEFGHTISLGGVMLTVDAANAKWSPIPAAPASVMKAAPVSDPAPSSSQELSPDEQAPSQEMPAPEPALVPEPPSPARTASGRITAASVAWGASAFVIAFLLIAALLFLRQPEMQTAEKLPASFKTPVDLTGFRKVLAELHLENSIRIDVREDGPYLSGIVDNNEVADTLADRLASFVPRPGLTVMTRADLVSTGNAVVHRFSPLLHVACEERRCILRGTAMSASIPKQAASALAAEVPLMSKVDIDVRLPADIAKQFLDELNRHEIGGIRADWDGKEVLVTGISEADGSEHIAKALIWLSEQCGQEIPFRVALGNQAISPISSTSPPEQPEWGRAPFDVVAVVEGGFPYVTVSGGKNLHLGSSYMGYRLASIHRDEIVFEGPRVVIFKR